jgi:hypothetical protein
MTVGDCDLAGDRAGDLPSPALTGGSPLTTSSQRAALGRSWALVDDGSQSSSDGEEGDEFEEGSKRADYYLCRSPSPDENRDLVETTSGLDRQAEKRLLRQRRQRLVSRVFASPEYKVILTNICFEGACSPRLPVLEPSTFPIIDGDDQGWTVVQRRHRSSPRPTVSNLDPKSVRISNSELLGSVVDHNGIRARVPGRPPSLNAANREARRSKAHVARSKS